MMRADDGFCRPSPSANCGPGEQNITQADQDYFSVFSSEVSRFNVHTKDCPRSPAVNPVGYSPLKLLQNMIVLSSINL